MLCFVCEKSGNVKKFTDERLEKCHKILAFRKKKVFKYRDIELPGSLFDKGYHMNCYNRFIVLRSSNKEEFESMFKNKESIFKNGQVNIANSFFKCIYRTWPCRELRKVVKNYL